VTEPTIQVIDLQQTGPDAVWREPLLAPAAAARFRAAALRLVLAYLDYRSGPDAHIEERTVPVVDAIPVQHRRGVIIALSDLLHTWRTIAIEHGGWDASIDDSYHGTAEVLALGQGAPVRELALAVLEAQMPAARAGQQIVSGTIRAADGDLVAGTDLIDGELHMLAAMTAWTGSRTFTDQTQLRTTLNEQTRIADQAATSNS
jgi:hypothetical protein